MQSKADDKFLLRIYLDTVHCAHTHDLFYDKFTLVGTSQSGVTKGDLEKSNQTIATPLIETHNDGTYRFPVNAASLLFQDFVQPDDYVAVSLTAQDVDFVSAEKWDELWGPLVSGIAGLTKDTVDSIPVKKPEGGGGGGVQGEIGDIGPEERLGDLNLKVDGEFIKKMVDILCDRLPPLVGAIIKLDKPDKLGEWPGLDDPGWMKAKDWRDLANDNGGRHTMTFQGRGWRGDWDYRVNYVVETQTASRLRRLYA